MFIALQGANCTGSKGIFVHDAGVQLHLAYHVGQAAYAHTHVRRIGLNGQYAGLHRVQGTPASTEDSCSVFEPRFAIT